MRAGPLSNARVVALLNRYFVPVYLANEDYADSGTAAAEERAERQRILSAFQKANLSAGTVQVFILMDGQPVDALHVAHAAKVERLVGLLERTIAKLQLRPGPPVVRPRPQSVPATRPGEDTLTLHVITRYLMQKGNVVVTNREEAGLGTTDNASWAALPGEDWVILGREEWARLIPTGPLDWDRMWVLDKKVAATFCAHFYPPSENNNVANNRIKTVAIQARVIAVDGEVLRIRLDGLLKMEHAFFHHGKRSRIEAPLVGYLDYDGRRRRIRSFQLVTDGATYDDRPFGAIVRSE